MFQFITYADDTTITSTLNIFKDQGGRIQNNKINNELNKINNWLKANKLSLNVKKTKFMIFRKPQKKVEIPVLHIGGENIDCVNNFNFLGIVLNEHLNWHSHTTKIANKICKIIGILNKLKHILPQQILSTIYTSLITPHVNYGILLWGHEATRIYKLQKKAIRTISKSKYNAHTEPIFKKLQFLKLNDIFKLQQLKFYYKLIKGDLPKYFQNFSYIHNFEIHHHYTRETSSIFIPRVNHAYAQKHIRHNLIQTINNTPNNIIDKIHTHSLRGFLNYIKVFIFGNYEDHCHVSNCYIGGFMFTNM